MSLHVFASAILISHWLIIVLLSIRVIGRRLPTGYAVAWLAVIFSVPFAGAAAYLLVGEKRLGRLHRQRALQTWTPFRNWQRSVAGPQPSEPEMTGLARHATRLSGFAPVAGNQIDLLEGFDTVVDRMVSDINSATSTCELSFYIWHAAGRVISVCDAIRNAAQRGVRCRVLADAVGSSAFLRSDTARRLEAVGVEIVIALPSSIFNPFGARVDLRNHRKIVVIDETVAYTGSLNMADPRHFKTEAGVGQWVDAMTRITGPAMACLAGVLRADWARESGAAFQPPAMNLGSSQAGPLVQVVPSGPESDADVIHQLILSAIYAAQRELIVTTPYFVPDDSVHTALQAAVGRGVDVTLVLPAQNDSLLVRHASAAYFDDLLLAGASIALFHGGLLHTKSMTIDSTTSLFGSVNLDMRSFYLNFEVSLLIYDAGFTSQLKQLQQSYLRSATLLTLEDWRMRPRSHRAAEDAFRLLGPLL